MRLTYPRLRRQSPAAIASLAGLGSLLLVGLEATLGVRAAASVDSCTHEDHDRTLAPRDAANVRI